MRRPLVVRIGALGKRRFPAGWYVYTGSAKRHLAARVERHLSLEKRLRWHIDHLLAHPDVQVAAVATAARPECAWHQALHGEVVVPGLGASDCRAGCGAHLVKVSRVPAHLAAGNSGADPGDNQGCCRYTPGRIRKREPHP